MIIIISGTPGTGKTTLVKKLAKELSYSILDITKLVKEEKLYDSYDKKDKTYEVDPKKLNQIIKKKTKENDNLIIDSHLAHYYKQADLCIITKCDLKKLKTRLEKRNYTKKKIQDNLDAEIFNTCVEEAKEFYDPFVINTTQGIKKEDLSAIVRKVNGNRKRASK